MLTVDILKANAATSALSDEAINAIVEMSRNDETSVIGQKTGEIYGGLDNDILAASGIAKNGTEKTYDYAKRVIGEIKGQAGNAAQMQAQIADLTKEKARLEAAVAKGGDAETQRALQQAKADLAAVTGQYTELKTKYDAAEQQHAQALMDVRLDGEFARASAGLKFKPDIPASVHPVLVRQAVEKVKAMRPEFIDDGQNAGTKILAFKDETGAILRNPETNLNPFTAAELVQRELRGLGVLEDGRKQAGTGTRETPPGGGTGGAVDISGARTQSEAADAISKTLLAQGMTIGSDKYQQAFDEAWKNNLTTIKALPLR